MRQRPARIRFNRFPKMPRAFRQRSRLSLKSRRIVPENTHFAPQFLFDFGLQLFTELKARNVLALGEFDHQRIFASAIVIILAQLDAQAAGQHPYQRIATWIVGIRLFQHLCPDDIFLQRIGIPCSV